METRVSSASAAEQLKIRIVELLQSYDQRSLHTSAAAAPESKDDAAEQINTAENHANLFACVARYPESQLPLLQDTLETLSANRLLTTNLCQQLRTLTEYSQYRLRNAFDSHRAQGINAELHRLLDSKITPAEKSQRIDKLFASVNIIKLIQAAQQLQMETLTDKQERMAPYHHLCDLKSLSADAMSIDINTIYLFHPASFNCFLTTGLCSNVRFAETIWLPPKLITSATSSSYDAGPTLDNITMLYALPLDIDATKTHALLKLIDKLGSANLVLDSEQKQQVLDCLQWDCIEELDSALHVPDAAVNFTLSATAEDSSDDEMEEGQEGLANEASSEDELNIGETPEGNWVKRQLSFVKALETALVKADSRKLAYLNQLIAILPTAHLSLVTVYTRLIASYLIKTNFQDGPASAKKSLATASSSGSAAAPPLPPARPNPLSRIGSASLPNLFSMLRKNADSSESSRSIPGTPRPH